MRRDSAFLCAIVGEVIAGPEERLRRICMKKVVKCLLLLCVLFVTAAVAAACEKKDDRKDEVTPAATAAPGELSPTEANVTPGELSPTEAVEATPGELSPTETVEATPGDLTPTEEAAVTPVNATPTDAEAIPSPSEAIPSPSETTPTPAEEEPESLYHPCGGNRNHGQYKGLEITQEKIVISEEDIDEQIKNLVANYPNYVKDADRDGSEVQNGDVVNIDFVGKRDGVAFDGGTGSDHFLEIGSNSFIPGFESSLIGKKIGTTVDIDVTFPESYTPNPDLAGVAVVFTVTLNYVAKNSEAIDDAYVVANVPNVATTVEGLREYIRDYLTEDAEAERENDLLNELLEKIYTNSEFTEILQEDIDFYYDMSMSQVRQYAELFGMTEEELFNMYSGDDAMSYAEFVDECKKNAENSVREFMVLQAIAKAENFAVSEEEYQKIVAEYAESVGSHSIADLEAEYGKDYLEYCVLTDKVLDFIRDNAVITVKGE